MKRLPVALVLAVLLISLASCFSSGAKGERAKAPISASTIEYSPVSTTLLQEQETTATVPPTPESDDTLVRVTDYLPDVSVDLKYATEDNFTGQIIYGFSDVYLRYGTVKKLLLVQQELAQQGLSLLIWDGFRPPSAQLKLWEICPDPTYVSDPSDGFSSHSRGNTVDITLVDSQGEELVMPTGFDHFSALADRDYSDCSPEAAANALLLEELMHRYGFKGYYGEWWHYTDTVDYPVDMDFVPQ